MVTVTELDSRHVDLCGLSVVHERSSVVVSSEVSESAADKTVSVIAMDIAFGEEVWTGFSATVQAFSSAETE